MIPMRDGRNPFLSQREGALLVPGSAMQDPSDMALSGTIIPTCHTGDKALLMMERWNRADAALSTWATPAKKCFDYVEGRQWSAESLAAAEDDGRPTVTLNKVAVLLRLVVGYFKQNRLENVILPTNDMSSTEGVAEVLSKIIKQEAVRTREPYLHAAVVLDGLIGGRGYYDWRLDFENNDFGELKGSDKDPFTIRPDPDADTYNPDGWGHVFEARYWSVDEIEFTFGRNVRWLIDPLMRGYGYNGGIGSEFLDQINTATPWRTFGGSTPDSMAYETYLANVVDAYRKNVLVVDCQHRIRVMQKCIVDLETGQRYPIPDGVGDQQVQKMLAWADEQYAVKGKLSPLRLQNRPVRRVRWTTMIGDIIVYDSWSKYKNLTIVPYFPYFRRGKTRGMVEDLIGPQDEVNLRRSGQIDILTRIAHSGWIWHKASLSEEEKEKLERFGAAAGVNIEYQGSPDGRPERIMPGTMPTGIEKLEEKATMDLKEIAGISDSALGQLDRVQSGRAIEARQKQSLLGAEMYMDNHKLSVLMCGDKKVELIQQFYTEPRLFRIQGEGGGWSSIGINVPNAVGEIANNVTSGTYTAQVSVTPVSETFLSAQTEELMDLIERGILPVQMVQDIAVDISTLPQKALIKARLGAYLQAMGLPSAEQLVQMQQQGIPLNPSMIAPTMGAEQATGSGGSQPKGKEKPIGGAGPARPANSQPQPAAATQ